MPQIIPIKDLRNTAEISELCKQTGEPIFVTKNGYGDMVIMSMEAYEERLAQWEITKKLNEAEEEMANGVPAIPADEVFDKLKKKYGI